MEYTHSDHTKLSRLLTSLHWFTSYSGCTATYTNSNSAYTNSQRIISIIYIAHFRVYRHSLHLDQLTIRIRIISATLSKTWEISRIFIKVKKGYMCMYLRNRSAIHGQLPLVYLSSKDREVVSPILYFSSWRWIRFSEIRPTSITRTIVDSESLVIVSCCCCCHREKIF